MKNAPRNNNDFPIPLILNQITVKEIMNGKKQQYISSLTKINCPAWNT